MRSGIMVPGLRSPYAKSTDFAINYGGVGSEPVGESNHISGSITNNTMKLFLYVMSRSAG
ncbi:hypothetical protein A3F66_00520 [candidate division TM6 bacterium RIFCSPHIGHO2_12_FULL_32_22]|nr:MAG: hypothetical protein A3F66_00520 [candidate division TM6 bacterium RIFCSPHIGHO2_12_FULL_32_22]